MFSIRNLIPIAMVFCWVGSAAAQRVLSDADLRSQVVGTTFLLGDGRVIRFDPAGDYSSVNGRGQFGRGRWAIDTGDICVDYTGSNTARRCFTFSRFPDGLRVTDRDRTNQPAVPTSIDIKAIGTSISMSACEHTIPHSLTPPRPDVPQNARLFSGAWVGKWESGLCAALFVQQVLPDGTARLVVGWGSHVARKPGNMGMLGKIQGNSLTAAGDGFSYDFRMVDPTTLDGVFHGVGATVGKLTKVK